MTSLILAALLACKLHAPVCKDPCWVACEEVRKHEKEYCDLEFGKNKKAHKECVDKADYDHDACAMQCPGNVPGCDL